MEILGECLSTAEGILKEVMGNVENGEVPEVLRGAKFISIVYWAALYGGGGGTES